MKTEIVKSDHFKIVEFNGTKLVCPIINGQPFVVMKCVFDDLKMHAKTATGSLKNHPRFGERVVEWRPVKSDFGLSNKHTYICLPFRKIGAWLYSVNINQVGNEVKQILAIYQERCDDVLFDHFYGGKKDVVSYSEKALPLSADIKAKEHEIAEASKVHEKTEAYITLMRLKAELSNLKGRKRRLDSNFLNPTLF